MGQFYVRQYRHRKEMVVASEVLYWSLAVVGVWVGISAIFREGCQSKLSAPTPREQGNAMVSEAQDGYYLAVLGTVVVAYLSPLGEAIVAGFRTTGAFSALPPAATELLTNGAVLIGYALLALVGVIVVYLSVRGTYLRTTDKRPPLGDGIEALAVASILQFLPAYVVVLLTSVGRRPVVSGLFVALFLVIAVPVLRTVHDNLLVESRPATDEELSVVTAGSLPDDIDLHIGPDEFDSHQIAVSWLLSERPQVFLGSDVFADLSDETIRTILRVGYQQSGWTHALKTRAPVGVWLGLMTALLAALQLGFLPTLAALVGSYLAFAFTAGRALQGKLLAVPDDCSEAELLAAFEEFAETRRVPIESYADPNGVSAEGVASALDIDAEATGDTPGAAADE